MGKRENTVETYLKECVQATGGDTRKWVSPGRSGVPDQIVMIEGEVWFVECKTVDGAYEPGQEREHQRLRDLGMRVRTVWGKQGVDNFMREVLK